MKNSLFFFAVYKKLFTFAPAKHKNERRSNGSSLSE